LAGRGSKELLQDLLDLWKVKRGGSPALIIHRLSQIIQVIEDTYSVANPTELQEAIDAIGSEAGTIFLESGTHEIDTPIDIDGGGSYVIYGHGDNTILEPADGVNVFNVTDADSLVVRTLKIDVSNYTLLHSDTQVIVVNEADNNVIGFYDVTIIGDGSNGIGIELQSDNSIIDHCNITQLKTGVYINNSENHLITGSFIGLNANYGIRLNLADSNTITGNSCISNTLTGLYIYDSDYCIISHNAFNSNINNGIYLEDSNYNTISSNACIANTQNGIYITQGSYNTLSSNTISNNDSITVNAQAGLYLTNNSDYNTITANSVNNNNNTGIGTGYGIYIAAATCNNNVVASNNANGNDIDFMDAGTATTKEYYVQNSIDLQDAIDSIGSKAGVINIDASFTVATTIDIDGGGSYIIQGEGSNSTLTLDVNITCFNITDARQVILQNFKIDATAYTGAGMTQEIIDVSEAADNLVIIDNVTITGDGTNGYGIEANSNNVQIKNCNIDLIDIGISLNGDNCLSTENIIGNCDEYGMDITGDYCLVSHNTINACRQGMQLNAANYCNVDSNVITASISIAGMYVFNLTGSNISNNTITTTVDGSGIVLDDVTYSTAIGNICDNNNDSIGLANAGIMIVSESDNNHITGNTCINNNNTAGGVGYGIYIEAATCNNNIIRGNSFSGNDVQWKDNGTNSDFEYRCFTAADIQNAIDSIGTKAGTIIIASGTITLTAAIDIDGGGSYIIKGQADNTIIDVNGDWRAFDISSVISCRIEDLKITAGDITTANREVIYIHNTTGRTTIDNITIDCESGVACPIKIDGTEYTTVQNSVFENILGVTAGAGLNGSTHYGLYILNSSYTLIERNHFTTMKAGTGGDGGVGANGGNGGTMYVIYNSSERSIIENNIFDMNIFGGDGGDGGVGDPAGNGGDGGNLYLIYVYMNDNLIKANRVDRTAGVYNAGNGGNGGETNGGAMGTDGNGGDGGVFYGIYVFSDLAPQTNEVLLNAISGNAGNGGDGGNTGLGGLGGNGGAAYGIVDECGAMAINSNYIGIVVAGNTSAVPMPQSDGNVYGIWLNAVSHTSIIGNQIQLSCAGGGNAYSIFGNGAEDLNIIIGNYCLTGVATITVAGANDIILGNITMATGEAGWSGWFDDGVNFRVTVLNGIITAVANSTGGGHNP